MKPTRNVAWNKYANQHEDNQNSRTSGHRRSRRDRRSSNRIGRVRYRAIRRHPESQCRPDGHRLYGQQPSAGDDVVKFPMAGTLWEATTTVDAVQGTVTPAIPFFNARADNGQNYRALYQALAPEGVSGTPLPQGAESSGKVYFDVTGAQPTSVVYNDAVQDRLVWGT